MRWLVLVLLVGCARPGEDPAAEPDAPPDDASAIDVAMPPPIVRDATAPDASAPDAGEEALDAASDTMPEAGSTWNTPTCDGVVQPGEYGGTGNEQGTMTGQTWAMTWDQANLYVALENANVAEGAILYVGFANNGLAAGQTYDNTRPGSMIFSANSVVYAKQGYDEVRVVLNNAWGTPNANAIKMCGQNLWREMVLPWAALGGNGIPSSFRFVVYVTSSNGFVYAQAPSKLPGGMIGTNAKFGNDFYVSSTNNGFGSFPFDTVE